MADRRFPRWFRFGSKTASSDNPSDCHDENQNEDGKYGPQVLSEPTNADGPIVDVIFVHGLRGNRIETWSKTTNGSKICWPRDLLRDDLKNARIITWGYNADVAHLLSMASQASIFGHAQSLLADVAALSDGKRPIIWVGHSLGGLVIKQAIILAAEYKMHQRHPEQGEIYTASVGFVFLGTPHRGSGKEGLGQVVANIARASFRKPNKQLLASLARDSHILETQRDQFITVSRDFPIACFYETIPMSIGMIVPQHSAVFDGFKVQAQEITENHSGMVKFASSRDIGYVRIRQQLSRMIENHQKHVDEIETAKRNVIVQDIITKLLFPGMDDRNGSIDEAHEHTLEWALDCEATSRARRRHLDQLRDDTSDTTEPSMTFVEWLETNRLTLFWISGKPGSGKSTLMKWMYHQPRTTRALEAWAGGGRLYRCSFFMYDRGAFLQKSREGMLRALLVQLLQSDGELANVAYPDVFENQPYHDVGRYILQWQALYDAFMNVVNRITKRGGKVCILLDALDEYRNAAREAEYTDADLDMLYDGDDRDKGLGPDTPISMDLADIAQLCLRLGRLQGVKLIVASRELAVFERFFDEQPCIRMQEHTKDDIRQYASDRLRYHSVSWGPTMSSVLDQVVKKACGVFLWTRLIVDLLADDLINMDGDDMTKLQRTVESAPPRLLGPDGLYMKMMRHIRTDNLLESSRIFQLVQQAEQPLPASIALYALKSLEAISRGYSLALKESTWLREQFDADEDTEIFRQKVKSRCAGLVECEPPIYRVDFMHQTAKEFVLRRSVWAQLIGHVIDDEIDIRLALLSGSIIQLKTEWQGAIQPPTAITMTHAISSQLEKAIMYATRADRLVSYDTNNGTLYVELVQELDRIMRHIHDSFHTTTGHKTPDSIVPNQDGHEWPICHHLELYLESRDFLDLAAHHDLATFLKAIILQLDDASARSKMAQSLLDGPSGPFRRPPGSPLDSDQRGWAFSLMLKPRTLHTLIQHGANTTQLWETVVRMGLEILNEDPPNPDHFPGMDVVELTKRKKIRWIEVLGLFLDSGVYTAQPIVVAAGSENEQGRTIEFPVMLQELLGGNKEFRHMIPDLLQRGKKGRVV